jgi:signal transduction histidine kinase
MKNKFSLLISISVLALLALSGIQAYLISNTYELKKKDFLRDTDNKVSAIANLDVLDSLYFDSWGDDLALHISDYMNKRIDLQEVIRRQKAKANSLNPIYMDIYEASLDSLDLGFDVSYHKILEYVVVFDGERRDTIFKKDSKQQMILFGEKFDHDDAVNLSNSRWYGEQEYITTIGENIVTNTYDLEVRTANMMLIEDRRSIVLTRMAVLLIGSVVLFLFVIGLLYYSIKGLIKQKKIAEIKTDFINNITHELKTPLATLGIATKSLRNETIKSSPDAFDTTLDIVERQNSRLQKLIDQVLTNSLSAANLVLNKEQLVDNQIFENLIADFQLAHQHGDVRVINDVYAPEVLLRLDRFHFTTAIMNVLENAVKYGKDQTIITVRTKVKNGQYIIEISDNGIGIALKDQKAIFDKFYRAGDSNVHDVKGLGLGLYFPRQIIKAHQGTIGIESEVNEGTTFRIKIPV